MVFFPCTGSFYRTMYNLHTSLLCLSHFQWGANKSHLSVRMYILSCTYFSSSTKTFSHLQWAQVGHLCHTDSFLVIYTVSLFITEKASMKLLQLHNVIMSYKYGPQSHVECDFIVSRLKFDFVFHINTSKFHQKMQQLQKISYSGYQK